MTKTKNIDYLKGKKIKLTFIFTFIVFLVLMISEVSFLWFKYFGYRNTEIEQLNNSISRASEFISNNVGNKEDFPFKWYNKFRFQENGPLPIHFSRPDTRDEKFLFFNEDWSIVFSSLDNDEFDKFLIDSILSGNINNQKYIFKYNWVEFFYAIRKFDNLDKPKYLVVFTVRLISKTDILLEFLNYLALSLILCWGLYFLIYKFISYNLKPVEDNINDMEQFIYNAGHELKTPLAVVSSSLQLAKFSKNYWQAIDESILEINRINSLIEVLIEFSTIKQEFKNTNFCINTIVKNILKNYQSKLDERKITLKIKENYQTNLFSNQEHFEILISNIISNAIKYNKPSWEINITIDKKFIEIKDTGIWVSKENLDKIFERFYQENAVRNQEGFGIWLSLVKKITDIYWRKIDISSEKDIWTSIKIVF